MGNKRHEVIQELVKKEKIETQEQLVNALAERGYMVTQATVSRDIKSLGLKKKMDNDGNLRYVCHTVTKDVPEHFTRVLREGFVSSDLAMNILVIKTVAGMAMAVAAALDAYSFPELVGCIAGDDTVMCAIRDAKSAKNLQKKINDLVDS